MGFIGNYIRNLASMAGGREPVHPLLFSYYITHRCSLGCGYCSDGEGRRFRENPVAELSTSDAVALVDIISRSSDTLDITGGEPMLREDLEDVLEAARTRGMRTVLNTKSIGLSARPGIMELTDVLVVGVDSLDRTRLASVIGRDRAAADDIMDGLSYAVSERRRTGTCVVISAVLTPDNLAEVDDVLDYAVRYGLGFHASPEITGTCANPALRRNATYINVVDRMRMHKNAGRGVLGIPEYLHGIRDFSRFKCHPLLMPVIRPDGRLYYPCLESGSARVSIAEYGSYEDALRAAREQYGDIPLCRDCCHIFCHMALSLLQRNPISAIRELRSLRAANTASGVSTQPTKERMPC